MPSTLPEDFLSGGSGAVPSGTSDLTLKKVLENLITPKSLDTIAVASHTVTLSAPGEVVSVTATTATSAGAKVIRSTGTPAAGEVRVTYDASTGIPTLLFATADVVSVTSVQQKQPLSLT